MNKNILNEILIEWDNNPDIEDSGIIKASDVEKKLPNNRSFNVNGVSFNMIYVDDFHEGNFWIGETPVTQELWFAVMDEGNNTPSYNDPQAPMDHIDWNDCQTFISKLNKLTNKKFKLPSKDEWLFAARNKNNDKYYYAGSYHIDEVAWYLQNSEHIMPVKLLKPNKLGIYDMSGNVEEWLNTKTNRGFSQCLVIGGCRNFTPPGCVISPDPWINEYYPSSAYDCVGFRLALK